MGTTGEQLFDFVKEYSDLGIHRAGTDVDRATVEWLVEKLNRRGLRIGTQPVPFSRWVVASRLTVDGVEIEHLPVFYEWTGSVATDRIRIEPFDPGGGHTVSLSELRWAPSDPGAEALILATEHPEGSLVAINRKPVLDGGIPTVLVAGRDHERLQTGPARLEMRAAVVAGETTNLIAANDIAGPPLLLTTPLTGWFTCAGERGTGVAVLLDLIQRCSHLPLIVIATGGHELDYLGVRHWVQTRQVEPAAIIHVGASVAVDAPDPGGGRELIASRLAMTSAPTEQAAPIVDALAPIGLAPITSTAEWLGESEVFCDVGAPMLSLTGAGIDFHTPDDIPDRATSAASLERVALAITEAAIGLYELSRRPR